MKKHNLKFFLITVLVISGIFTFSLFLKLQNNPSSSSAPSDRVEQIAPRYFEYSKERFTEASKDGRVVLFFWAPWCGTCSFLDGELKKRNSELPSDLTILRTNYDTDSDLKNKYGVVFQHTLVQVDKNGSEIKKWIGGGVDLLKEQIK